LTAYQGGEKLLGQNDSTSVAQSSRDAARSHHVTLRYDATC